MRRGYLFVLARRSAYCMLKLPLSGRWYYYGQVGCHHKYQGMNAAVGQGCQQGQQPEEYVYPSCLRLLEMVRQWSRPPWSLLLFSSLDLSDQYSYLLRFHNLAAYAPILPITCFPSLQALFTVSWCHLCISIHRDRVSTRFIPSDERRLLWSSF